MNTIRTNIIVIIMLVLFVGGVFAIAEAGVSLHSPGEHSGNTLKSAEIPGGVEEELDELIADVIEDMEDGFTSGDATDERKPDDIQQEVQNEEESEAISEDDSEEPILFEDILETTQVSYEDTLFIGDSRAEGISEYAGIEGATFYTASGMSVYNIHKQRRIKSMNRRVNLETVLDERQFGRIYVILGINELGYRYDITQERYEELVEYLEQKQPGAMIILHANLHVTASRAAGDAHYNNEAIDRMNAGIAEIADKRGHFYLDINPVFDDENGGLGEEYTLDDTHVLAKYYPMWKDFLTEETRQILAVQEYELQTGEKYVPEISENNGETQPVE